MSKHILLYTDDPGAGGVAQYNDMIALGLRTQGYRVTIVQTQSDNPLVTAQQRAGIKHEWLDYDTVKEFGRSVGDSSNAQAIFPSAQPDLILFSDCCPLSNFAAKEVALQLGIPYVIVLGFVAPYLVERFGEGADGEYYLGMLERQYRRAREVIAVCRENLELLYKLFRLPSDKGRVIHYGRPEHFFSPRDGAVRDRLRKEVGVPAKGVLCFTAARLEPVKGFQYQLEAIATLRHTSAWSNLYFVWAGEGSMRPELEYALAELEVGDRVTLLGQRWDVAHWLEAADLFILPSMLEGMPLAIMEAMAKGVPVIASAVSGIPEELGTTGKLLTNPSLDPEATVDELVSTIQAWAVNPEARRAVGEAEQRRASQMFRQSRMVEETITVLQRALLSPNDYVSPELALVQPDEAFPNLIVGNPQTCPWPYLRREIPHNWYVDQRLPTVGFLSRDEAHILYNNALLFAGKRGLEIGCWMGWSACHMALAGVVLDVIDPQLSNPVIYDSVFGSLQAAGVSATVTLIADYSPQAVEAIATQHQRKWSLIFIDGDHEAPGPLQDAIACDQLAEADAMILLHDLASPDVAVGLDYLKQQGWNTMVYQTMQIMGVAWRGAVEPVAHQPDPRVHWILPPHLQGYRVSEISPQVTPPPATFYTPPPAPAAYTSPISSSYPASPTPADPLAVSEPDLADQAQRLMQSAIALTQQGNPVEALRQIEAALALDISVPNLHYCHCLMLCNVGRHKEGLAAAQAELALDPNHTQAQAKVDELRRSLTKPVQPEIPTAQRPWHSGLPYETLKSIHLASHHYSHRGVPMIKDPFDVALYPLLIWNLKPRTIIEIGSKEGGSALWLADLCTTYEIDAQVYSIDIVPVTEVSHPRVTFLEGNGRALRETLNSQLLARLPRPWLVIDDADHAYETTHHILEFFHPHLRADEYIVVEDGIISDYTRDLGYNSGPHRALKEFLANHPDDYVIDGSYCDFFGYNLTWNTNGYLKKRVDPPMLPQTTPDAASANASSTSPDLQYRALQLLLAGAYVQASQYYERLIETEPEVKLHYWYYGLALLLQGEEIDAQTAWFLAMSDGNTEEIERWTAELVQVLATEAQRQSEFGNQAIATALQQHIQALVPDSAPATDSATIPTHSTDPASFTAPDAASDEIPDWVERDASPAIANSLKSLKPLKIVVDGVFFQFGSQSGISRVWKSLLMEWAKTGFIKNILVLDRNNTAPKIFGVRYCLVPPFDYGTMADDRLLMQQICDEEAADLFVSTYYTSPLITPSAFIAYDMIPEVLGQDLDNPMWQQKHDSIHSASAYLAISDSTRRDLVRFFPEVLPELVTVAHCGLDADFQPASAQQIQQFQANYGIQQPYFLVVGDRLGWQGYKNTIQFFKAFAQLPNRQDCAIVAVGFNTTLEPELAPYAADATLHLLPLSDAELKVAYSGAIALVYPSKYEGFGLPVLEAMACGCPVIACRTSSIPEVGGEAVLYVEPDDVDGLTAALQTVQKPDVRDRLIATGLTQARQFSWQRMADMVSEALTDAVRSPRPISPDVALLTHLLPCIRAYQQDPADPAALDDLRDARQQLAQRWLSLTPEVLPSGYRGVLGQAQQALLSSGLKDERLTEVEQAAIAPILATLQAGVGTDGQRAAGQMADGQMAEEAIAPLLAPLLVAMLYCHPYQLPTPLPLPLLPTWILPNYVSFLVTNPGLFWHEGELAHHADYVAEWTAHIHQNVMSQPGDRLWQTVAQQVAQQSSYVPLYFVERELKTLYQQRAEILSATLADLGQPLEFEFPVNSGDRSKLRLGVLAHHFAPQTETFATLPVFQHLDRQQFEVILLTIAPIEHRLARHCAESVDAVIELPSSLPDQVQTIRRADLDILFIATNVTAIANSIAQLSAYRLARVQITGMNSPLSTGMPQIDYYLSSRLTNPTWNVQRHYSETLVPLSGAAQCFDFATEGDLLPTVAVSRESLGIAADTVVFVSGANFFKITPELDTAWAQIIARVPNSILLLYPFNPNWTNHYPAAAFRQRLTAHFADQGLDVDRVVILEAAPNRADVIERLKLADIYLDSYPFSGMTSLLEPLEIGLPVVVVETDVPVSLGRGAAFLRELQVPELIADGAAAYIELAIALGTDPTRRQGLRDRIQQAMGRNPSFLNSDRYGAELSMVFQSLFHTYQHTQLAQTFRLQKTNLIAFPDWNQPDEILFTTLTELLRTVLTASDRQHTTLLIYTGDFDAEAADLVLSSVTLDLLAETELDLDDDSPEIILLPSLMPTQWQALLSHLTTRLALLHEDQAAIAQSGAGEIPVGKG